MTKPQWVIEKEKINQTHIEQQQSILVLVGELGASGVIDGKLPDGSDYEWKKKRDQRSRTRLRKLSLK